jgi:hypothetical protein
MKTLIGHLSRRAITIVGLILFIAQAGWGVPVQVPYSGQLAENGELVNGSKSMVFKVLDGTTEVYSAGPVSVPVTNGLFQVYIGGTGMPALDHSVFQTPSLLLRVLVEGQAIVPDIELSHAPYAAVAERINSLDGAHGGTIILPVRIAEDADLDPIIYDWDIAADVATSLTINDHDASPGSRLTIEAAPGQVGNLFELKDATSTVRASTSIDGGNNLNWNFGDNKVSVDIPITGEPKLRLQGVITADFKCDGLDLDASLDLIPPFKFTSKGSASTPLESSAYIFKTETPGFSSEILKLFVGGGLTLGTSGDPSARIQRNVSNGRLVVAGGGPVDNDDAEVVFCSAGDAFAPGALLAYTGGIERLRIHPDGNVGINEVLPDAKLHVSFPGNVWDGTTPWVRMSSPLSTRAGLMFIPEVDDEVLVAFEGDLTFKAGTLSRVSLPESGIEVLSASGDIRATGDLKSFGSGGGGGGRVRLSVDNGVTFGDIRGDAGGALHLESGGGGGGRITLQAPPFSGVMIAPGPTGVSMNQGDFQVMGNLCATGTIGPCSDERLKENFSPIEGALEKIEQIEGMNFEWNREEFPDFNFSEGNQIGVIAQEVREVIPEAVSARNDGYLTVDYGRLTAVLIEAVKEQQKQIEELKTRLATIEKFTASGETLKKGN